MGMKSKLVVLVALAASILIISPSNRIIYAHCDTMDGPLIMDAKSALKSGDVTVALKWVKPEYEGEARDAFKRAVAVKGKGTEARELGETYFFETLVRLHREGEGAPYTGLKPAGHVEPIVAESDLALETGGVDNLVKAVNADIEAGIRERFLKVAEAKKRMNESVAAGREYVEAYVEFVHYVERIHVAASSEESHH